MGLPRIDNLLKEVNKKEFLLPCVTTHLKNVDDIPEPIYWYEATILLTKPKKSKKKSKK